jgi:two-component system LytT family response regulator
VSGLHALVVDDEPLARKALRMLLEADSEVLSIRECADGDAALEALAHKLPDVLFLDIEMPGASGLAIAESLRAGAVDVVFVTAHEEHALRAFEVSALDYLLKPFDDARFGRALARAKERVRQRRQLSAADARIAVRTGSKVVLVEVESIDWIGADSYYVVLHTGAETHLHREPLRDLEARLPPHFVRIHRSTVVNARRVKEVRAASGGDATLVLASGTELRVSRSHRAALDALRCTRSAAHCTGPSRPQSGA